MKKYWLSFCDPDLPNGQQFLGVALVPAEDFIDAIQRSRRLGCNPGGEVRVMELPRGFNPPLEFVGRLLDRAGVERLEATGWSSEYGADHQTAPC